MLKILVTVHAMIVSTSSSKVCILLLYKADSQHGMNFPRCLSKIVATYVVVWVTLESLIEVISIEEHETGEAHSVAFYFCFERVS